MAGTYGCKVSNDDIELTISATADIRAKYTNKSIENLIGESKFYVHKDPVILTNVIEDCPEVTAETEDKTENNLAALMNKKTASSETVEVGNDDNKFFDYSEVPYSGTSRKKIEIGSETMISNNDLIRAATLVHDAMEGRTVDFKAEPKYVKSYNRYKSWQLTYLLYLAIFVDLCLVMFEDPAMQGFAVHYSVTISVEGLCLVYFTIRICHNYHWRRSGKFFRDYKNIFIIGILTITFIDIVVYTIMKQVSPNSQIIRYSRVLRPLLIINFSDGRQIRRAWRNMLRTIKEIVHVLVLFYFFIFVFALIAYKMFITRDDMKYPDGKEYFKDYMDSVWDLYVLVTTANNPDVMIPAVEKSKFYCIFFFIYIFVCFYMLLNIFLAVAYQSYDENLKGEIKEDARDKKRKLGQAFDVIKINRDGKDIVTYQIWKRLMTLVQPYLSKNQIDLLMLILDMNRSGYIGGNRDFMNVADLLNIPVSEVEDRITYIEKWFPNMYNSIPAEYLKTFVDSFIFEKLYDIIVIIEVFFIGFEVPYVGILFCAMFSFEIAVKIFTYGPVKYFTRFGNWFDIVITTTSFVFISTFQIQDPGFTNALAIVEIMRIFRVLRLLVHIKRFKIIIETLINILLSIVLYCGILFIIFYMFAIIGMEVFKGKITSDTQNITNGTSRELYCGTPELENSSFYEARYCTLNFNDFISSVLVLSTILFVNNWHIIAEGYVLVAGKAARIYFAVFLMWVSVVIMNIVTAFVVNMFMYEYTIQKEGKKDSVVEKKIKELGLGIDAETDLEISAPLSGLEMKELQKKGNQPEPQHHHWSNRSTVKSPRNAEIKFFAIGSLVNKRKSSVPTLSRFDGIRFHIKKRGWTKIEVLLQHLYDDECSLTETLSHAADSTPNMPELKNVKEIYI